MNKGPATAAPATGATVDLSFTVSNVRMVGPRNSITFTLTVGGRVSINGCWIVESDKGDFVTLPSYKGKDGKYYNHVYMRLSDSERKNILDLVQAEIDKIAASR